VGQAELDDQPETAGDLPEPESLAETAGDQPAKLQSRAAQRRPPQTSKSQRLNLQPRPQRPNKTFYQIGVTASQHPTTHQQTDL
jgi:hypothetical protein